MLQHSCPQLLVGRLFVIDHNTADRHIFNPHDSVRSLGSSQKLSHIFNLLENNKFVSVEIVITE